MAHWTSKLGGRFLKEEIEQLDRDHHRILERLRKEPENSRCAECHEQGTMWASVNLGVFVCVRCADIHRALGTHISKVKGCTGTYLWGPDEIANMQSQGNAAAARRFGAAAPGAAASKEERVRFAERKYAHAAAAPPALVAAPVCERREPAPAAPPAPTPAVAPTFAPALAPAAARPVQPAPRAAAAKDSILSRPLSPPRHSGAPRKAAAAPMLDLIDFESMCGDVNATNGGWEHAAPQKAAVSDFDALLGPCVAEAQPIPSRHTKPAGRAAVADLGDLWNDFGSW